MSKNQVSLKGATPMVREVRLNIDSETLCPDCNCPIKETRGDIWCGCDMQVPWNSIARGIKQQDTGDTHIRMFFTREVDMHANKS